MKTNDEKAFDESIRKKLNDGVEEVPPMVWKEVSNEISRNWLSRFLSGLNGFLFTDVMLLLALGLFISINTADSNSIAPRNEQTLVNNEKQTSQHGIDTQIKKEKNESSTMLNNDQQEILQTEIVSVQENKNNLTIVDQDKKPVSDDPDENHITKVTRTNGNAEKPIAEALHEKQNKVIQQQETESANVENDKLITDDPSKAPVKIVTPSSRQKSNKSDKEPLKSTDDSANKDIPLNIKATTSRKDATTKNTERENQVAMTASEKTSESANSDLLTQLMLPVERKNFVAVIPYDFGSTEVVPVVINNKASDLPIASDQGSRPVSFSIQAGPSAWTGRFDTKSSSLLTLTDGHQDYPIGWHGALMLEYALSEKWNISAGIHHSNYNLSYDLTFQFQQPYSQVDSITGVVYFPFDPPMPLTIYDTNQYVMIKTGYVRSEFNIRSTDVAIQAQRLFERKLFSFRLGIGALLNISNKVEAPFKAVSEGNPDQVLSGNDLFEKQWGLGVLASGEMSFKLTKSISPFVSLTYENFIKDVMKESSPFELYLSQFNAGIGVRINFAK